MNPTQPLSPSTQTYPLWQGVAQLLGLVDSLMTRFGQADKDDSAQLAALQQTILQELSLLKKRWLDRLDESSLNACFAAIVFYLDEQMITQHFQPHQRWPLLQQSLYGASTGGAEFYALLDELLARDGQHLPVCEVFYFCLKDGFCGKYYDQPDRRQYYREQLESRLKRSAPPTQSALPSSKIGE